MYLCIPVVLYRVDQLQYSYFILNGFSCRYGMGAMGKKLYQRLCGAAWLFPLIHISKGINSTRSVDVTRITGTQQRPGPPTITPPGMQGKHSTSESAEVFSNSHSHWICFRLKPVPILSSSLNKVIVSGGMGWRGEYSLSYIQLIHIFHCFAYLPYTNQKMTHGWSARDVWSCLRHDGCMYYSALVMLTITRSQWCMFITNTQSFMLFSKSSTLVLTCQFNQLHLFFFGNIFKNVGCSSWASSTLLLWLLFHHLPDKLFNKGIKFSPCIRVSYVLKLGECVCVCEIFHSHPR